MNRGDIVDVYDCTTFQDWWKGSLNGQVGIFPANYVERVQTPTKPAGIQDDEETLMRHRVKVVQFKETVMATDPRSYDYIAAERIQVTFWNFHSLILTSEIIKIF